VFSTAEPTPGRTQRLMDDYVAIARRRRGSLAATALRTRSVDARQLLAHAVGGTATPVARILAAARDEDHEWLAGLRDEVAPQALADLARVLALQDLRPGDRADAYAVYELTVAVFGDPGPQHQALHVQLAYRLGHRQRVTELLARYPRVPDPVRDAVVTDLANPYAGGDAAATWAGRFQRLLPDDCVRLSDDTDRPPFDRLTVRGAPPDVDGPVVSVLLARDAAAGTALRSILAQSWTGLELLLVGGTGPVPDDPRVRLIDADDRNAALAGATGEFVAFADADTWSHPRRLEHQLAALLADPDAVASTSAAIKVGDDLTLTRPGAEPTAEVSVPSLVFRRAAVLGRIGYPDTVTAGAGTEYLGRIRAAFGDAAVHHLDTPYAFVRAAPAPRADAGPGPTHPARTAYLEASTAWHDRIRAGTADPYRSPSPTLRPFAAPHRLTPGRHPTSYDVVLGGEWSAFGGPQKSMIEEIRALTRRGRRVAIMHLDAYRFMSARRRGLCAQVRQLIDDGVVDRVLPGDDIDTALLVVRYPPVLQFTTDQPSGIRAKQVLILANQAPAERDGSDARYTPRTCADNARRLFGATARWAPQSPTVRDFLAADLEPEELAPFDVPGIIDADAWHVERTWLRGDRPVLGKHSRDNWAKWPADRATLLQAYPAALDIDVRLMGGVQSARALLGPDAELPANWRVYGYDEIDVRSFLGQLDFYVYFPHPNMVEAFGRAILEAMAAGCVVLMPHHFRRTFGDAALYCRPDEVEGVVRHLHADPEQFLELSRTAQGFVRTAFSHDAYADLVATLVD
jgi:glycosyltransferase involved in cell wall biosynthesis